MAYTFSQTGAEIQNILNLAQTQIASPYNTSTNYVIGDYCTRSGALYRCKAATSGTWSSSKWEAVTAMDSFNTDYSQNTADVSVSSGSWQVVYSTAQYPIGTYLVEYGGGFASNATGYRAVGINTDNSSFSANRWTPTAAAVNGQQTRMTVFRIYNITSASNFYVWAYQNSGSSLTLQAYIRVVRLK